MKILEIPFGLIWASRVHPIYCDIFCLAKRVRCVACRLTSDISKKDVHHLRAHTHLNIVLDTRHIDLQLRCQRPWNWQWSILVKPGSWLMSPPFHLIKWPRWYNSHKFHEFFRQLGSAFFMEILLGSFSSRQASLWGDVLMEISLKNSMEKI